jgi:hypothetical protein
MSTILNAEKDSGKWIPVMDPEMNSGKLIPEGENQFRKLFSERSLQEIQKYLRKLIQKQILRMILFRKIIPEYRELEIAPIITTFLKRGMKNILFEQQHRKETYGTMHWMA